METESVTITALAIVEALQPIQLFQPEHLNPILERIKAEVRATPKDISTPKGVEALKQLVMKVVKTKTFIESQRVALVADQKKSLRAIDAEGLKAWNELEALQIETRKPLTDWEDAEKERIQANNGRCDDMTRLLGPYATMEALDEAVKHLDDLIDFGFSWEFKQRASDTHAKVALHLQAERLRLLQVAADKAERERLHAEEVEKARVLREKLIADEAKAKADAAAKKREEALAKAAEQREAEATRVAALEKERLEKERLAAEQRAKDAEAERKRVADNLAEVQRKAEADRVTAEAARLAAERKSKADAELDRQVAAQKAEDDKTAAVVAERKRQEEARAAEEAEKQRREDDKDNRAKKHREALAAITRFGVDEKVAKTVVELIARKGVPHISFTY